MKTIAWIFWNASQRRLRTGWRILLFVALMFGLSFSLRLLPEGIPQAFSALCVLLLSFLGTWIAGRFLDRRSFADFGWHLSPGWWRDFGFGLALGVVLMSGIFLVEYLAGWASITSTFTAPEGTSFWLAILGPLLLFICVGIYEELLYRGYLLRNLCEGFNVGRFGARNAVWLAVALTSILFGLGHVMNPNASAISTINIVIAGVFLSYGYIVTRELAIPVGMHISWNFFQGHVFGFPVSGMSAGTTTFITIEQGGARGVDGRQLRTGSGTARPWRNARRHPADCMVGAENTRPVTG